MRASTLAMVVSLVSVLEVVGLTGCSSDTCSSAEPGGCAPPTGPGGSGGSGGGGGSGGAGGTGMPAMVNGCDLSSAIDKTADMATTITFLGGNEYTPRCVRIRSGTSVTFSGDFGRHPLQGGTASGATMTPDSRSPIPATTSGMEVTVAIPAVGTFGYYCTAHASLGMTGAIFSEPPRGPSLP